MKLLFATKTKMTVPENQTPDDSDVLPKTKKYIDQSTETNQVTIVKGWMNDNPNQMTNMLTTKEALNSFANQLQMRNKRDSSSSSETIDIINTLPNETKIDDKSVASPWVITPDVPADSAIANQYGITPVVQQKGEQSFVENNTSGFNFLCEMANQCQRDQSNPIQNYTRH